MQLLSALEHRLQCFFTIKNLLQQSLKNLSTIIFVAEAPANQLCAGGYEDFGSREGAFIKTNKKSPLKYVHVYSSSTAMILSTNLASSLVGKPSSKSNVARPLAQGDMFSTSGRYNGALKLRRKIRKTSYLIWQLAISLNEKT